MKYSKKITILLVVSILVSIGYVLFPIDLDHTSQSSSQERAIGEIARAESVRCGDEEYIFETVSTDEGNFTNVYTKNNSPENFVANLKSKKGGIFENFFVISTPQENCDKIYLTTHTLGDAPIRGLFEWRVKTKKMRELAIGEEFWQQYVPYPFKSKIAVAPNGEGILIANYNKALSQQGGCHYNILKLLDFREDTSKVLLQLSENEDFADGLSDLSPYCQGLSFGWIDDSTIYYDVYDATPGLVSYPTPRPVIERRTLLVK